MNLIVILLLFAIAIIVAIVLIRRKKDQGSITLEGGRKILVQPPRFGSTSGATSTNPDQTSMVAKINEGYYDISTNPIKYYLQERDRLKYRYYNLTAVPPKNNTNPQVFKNFEETAWIPITKESDLEISVIVNFKTNKYFVETLRLYLGFQEGNILCTKMPETIIIKNEYDVIVPFEKVDNYQNPIVNNVNNFTEIKFNKSLKKNELFRNIKIIFKFNEPVNFIESDAGINFAVRQIQIYGTPKISYKFKLDDNSFIKKIIPFPSSTFALSDISSNVNVNNILDNDLSSPWIPSITQDNEYYLNILFNQKVQIDKIRFHHRLPEDGFEIGSIGIYDDKLKSITNIIDSNGQIVDIPSYVFTQQDKQWVGKDQTWIDLICDYSPLNRCFIAITGNNRLRPIAIRGIEIFGRTEFKKTFPDQDGKQVIPNSIDIFQENSFTYGQVIGNNGLNKFINNNNSTKSIFNRSLNDDQVTIRPINKKIRLKFSFANPDGTKKFVSLYKIVFNQKIIGNPVGYGYDSMQLTGTWDNKFGRNTEIFYTKRLNVPERMFQNDYTDEFKQQIINLKGFELDKKLETLNYLRNPYVQRANNQENLNESNKKSEQFFTDFVTDRYEYDNNFQQIIDTDFILEFNGVEKDLTFYQIKFYAYEVHFPYYDSFVISRPAEIKDKNSPCYGLTGRFVGKYLTLSEIEMYDDFSNKIDILSHYNSGNLNIQMLPLAKVEPGSDNDMDSDNEEGDFECRKRWRPLDGNQNTFMHTCYDFPRFKEQNKSSLKSMSGPIYSLIFNTPIKVSRVKITTKPPWKRDAWKKDFLSCAYFTASLSDKNSMPNSDFNPKIIKLRGDNYIGIRYKDGTTKCAIYEDDGNCYIGSNYFGAGIGGYSGYGGDFGQVEFEGLYNVTFSKSDFRDNTAYANSRPNFRNWYVESSRRGKRCITYNGKKYPMQYFAQDNDLNERDTQYNGQLTCIKDNNGSCLAVENCVEGGDDIPEDKIKVCTDLEKSDPFNVCFEGKNKIIRWPTYEKFTKVLTFDVWTGDSRNNPSNNCEASAPCARNYYYFTLGVSTTGSHMVSGIDNGLNLCLDMNETRTQTKDSNNNVYFRPCVTTNVQQLLEFRKMSDKTIRKDDPNDPNGYLGRDYDPNTGECKTKNKDGICEANIPQVDKIYSNLTNSCLTKISNNKLLFLPCLTRNVFSATKNEFSKYNEINDSTHKNQRFYYDGKQIFFNPDQEDKTKDCSILENQENCECLFVDTNDYFKAKITKCNTNDSRQVFYKINSNKIVSNSSEGISPIMVSPNYYDKSASRYYYVRINQITADLERYVVIRENGSGRDIPFLIDYLGEVRGLEDTRKEIQPGPYTMEFAFDKPSTEKIEGPSIDNVNISIYDKNYGIVWNSLDTNTIAGLSRREQIDPMDMIPPYYLQLTDDKIVGPNIIKGGRLYVCNAEDSELYTIFN
jgi:hypothetical protein